MYTPFIQDTYPPLTCTCTCIYTPISYLCNNYTDFFYTHCGRVYTQCIVHTCPHTCILLILRCTIFTCTPSFHTLLRYLRCSTNPQYGQRTRTRNMISSSPTLQSLVTSQGHLVWPDISLPGAPLPTLQTVLLHPP